jgi:D-alanyl-D-alanine carboxypeptidase/D-alanyl-D-alanine-endopeptidase (penicillin-binding protein 4)
MRYAVAPVLSVALLLASSGVGLPDPSTAAVGARESSATDTGESAATEAGESAVTSPPVAPTAPSDVRPRVAALQHPLGAVSAAPAPDPAALREELEDELESEWLGPGNRRGLSVRDALTGEVLADVNADRLMTPASTTKLLAAAAIVVGLDAEERFTTRVVAGTEPGQVVIVAGGDMLLGDGPGDPEAVAGHAGIADLAAQTARSLRAGVGDDRAGSTAGVPQGGTDTTEVAGSTAADGTAASADAPVAPGTGPVTVALDLSHVAGPHAVPTWSEHWVQEGWTGRIVQLGRASDRALPFNPSPERPEQEVARVFREALAREGIEVVDAADDDASAAEVQTGPEAAELASVESAAVRDVLALALATSDNAMVEQLARQAAVAAGESPEQESVTAWITRTMVEQYGIDMTGMRVVDGSGLSDGTRLSMAAVASVLVAGSDGSHPALQEVLAAGGLPIAGYTGTLGNGMRFHLPVHAQAVGNARAKTGTLPGVTSLAGSVVTADGRLLVFAVGADRIGEDAAALEAASMLDEIVAQLARCGC